MGTTVKHRRGGEWPGAGTRQLDALGPSPPPGRGSPGTAATAGFPVQAGKQKADGRGRRQVTAPSGFRNRSNGPGAVLSELHHRAIGARGAARWAVRTSGRRARVLPDVKEAAAPREAPRLPRGPKAPSRPSRATAWPKSCLGRRPHAPQAAPQFRARMSRRDALPRGSSPSWGRPLHTPCDPVTPCLRQGSCGSSSSRRGSPPPLLLPVLALRPVRSCHPPKYLSATAGSG